MREGLAYVDTVTPDHGVMSYWREGACYLLDQAELDVLVHASERLFSMFIEAGDYIIQHGLFHRLGIPDWAVPAIRELWRDPEDLVDPARPGWYTPMLYGRFDLCPVLDGDGRLTGVKLFEYNADTPTAMPETAVTQWNWFVGNGWSGTPGNGQFNTLFEGLVAGWVYEVRKFRRITRRPVKVVHFAYSCHEPSGEDALNCGFMMEAARQAGQQLAAAGEPGFEVKSLHMCEIVRTGQVDEHDQPMGDQYFSDPDHTPIDVIFKLFPWEWMLRDEFGPSAVENMLMLDGTVWLEPIWKMLWSNKGILPVLWEVFKDRPEAEFLLEAYFEGSEPPGFRASAVRKPLHGREGSNVTILVDNEPLEQGPENYEGDDGQDGQYILQRYFPMPEFPSELDGSAYRPVLGVFTVQDEPVALIIREGPNRITNNLSYAVPHVLTGLA